MNNNKDIALKVSIVSIIVNTILSITKLITGIIGHSGAMISDAIHSVSDVFSTFIVMIGVMLSNKASDHNHPYGHERFECVSAIILAMMLSLTGIEIGINSFKHIFSITELVVPDLIALMAAIVSIVIKEWMYWYTRVAAIKINSNALMADAWHHRSDAFSSVGAFIGILGSRIGFPVLDSIASLVICLFIEIAAYDIFKDSLDKMIDKACDEQTLEYITSLIQSVAGVIEIDDIKTRLFGNKIYIDVEIAVQGDMTLLEGHQIAHNVHDLVESELVEVKHCNVHVNPIVNS